MFSPGDVLTVSKIAVAHAQALSIELLAAGYATGGHLNVATLLATSVCSEMALLALAVDAAETGKEAFVPTVTETVQRMAKEIAEELVAAAVVRRDALRVGGSDVAH